MICTFCLFNTQGVQDICVGHLITKTLIEMAQGHISLSLPHAELQMYRSNKTAVLSRFSNYDDACDHCSRTLSANSRWDVRYDKSVGRPSGANSASLEVDLGLETSSASLEPRLSYQLKVA
jgi:hypothetical protein